MTAQADASSPDKKTLLVFGDSLSAAYGMDSRKGWVNLLQEKMAESHPQWRVINASISGETTAGGHSRLPKALQNHSPDLVLLELGANDGLRGTPLQQIEKNIADMVQLTKQQGIDTLLFEMRIPPNYGPAYTSRFREIFQQVAQSHNILLLPFFLEGVAGIPSLNQPDGIHPNEQAQPRLMNNVWFYLEPRLSEAQVKFEDTKMKSIGYSG